MFTRRSAKTPATQSTTVPSSTAAAQSEPGAIGASDVARPRASAWRTGLQAIGLAVLSAIVVFAALTRPRLFAPAGTPGAEDPVATEDRSTDPGAPAQPTLAAPAAVPAAPVAPTTTFPKKTAPKAAKSAAGPVTIVRPPRLAETRSREEAPAKPADAMSSTASAPAAAAIEASAVDPVTITGCLEVSASDDRFRLTDTEGESVPKARSWRSGFLKKRPAAIDLVGVSDARALEMQVGKKVAATGVLTNRSLQINSVRVVSPHCE